MYTLYTYKDNHHLNKMMHMLKNLPYKEATTSSGFYVPFAVHCKFEFYKLSFCLYISLSVNNYKYALNVNSFHFKQTKRRKKTVQLVIITE